MKFPYYLFLLIELFVVAYYDLKEKKISNNWIILNSLVFLLVCMREPQHYWLFNTIIYFSLTLIIGFILFNFNIMGAGDSKYLAFFFILIPEPYRLEFLNNLLLVTIIVASYLIFYHSIKFRKEIMIYLKTKYYIKILKLYGFKFAYAPIILLSWIYLGWNVFQTK